MKAIEIYTDGGARGNGKKDSVSAWAYTLDYGEAHKRDYSVVIGATNNQMELKACIEALKAIKKRSYETNIYTDSKYVIENLTMNVKSWKRRGWKKSDGKQVLNLELWKELDGLSELFSDLKWFKVKGHGDNEGNNRVDELVNFAMDEYLNRSD